MPIEESLNRWCKMREYIFLFINGIEHKIAAKDTLKNLSEYLRETLNMKGTKVVCSEGDCGACTVLVNRYIDKSEQNFITINACIAPLYLLDCSHIVTIEGIQNSGSLHLVQEMIAKHHGTQCGFCTPGIVNSLVAMSDNLIFNNKSIDIKKIKNYTTGNLCRCTGYKGILEAGMALDLTQIEPLYKRYSSLSIQEALSEHFALDVVLENKENEFTIVLPKTIKQALSYKANGYTLISGGTDISVFRNKGFKKDFKFISLANIEKMYQIEDTEEKLSFSSMVSLTQVEKKCQNDFEEFSNLLKVFASPQIKNKGTLIGNIANGSPIGDSIPFLYVSDASLTIQNEKNSRDVNIADFYLGYKQFDLKNDEIITSVSIPKNNHKFKIYKVSARKDLDISAVSLAIAYEIKQNIFTNISIAFGGVAATVYKAKDIENILLNQGVTEKNFLQASSLVPTLLAPFSDHRGSSEFRIKLCQNLLMKFFKEVL